MLDTDQLRILTQLLDNLDVASDKLSKAYEKKQGEEFKKIKKEILEIHEKISQLTK